MPTFGAYSLDGVFGGTCVFVTATYSVGRKKPCTVHDGAPSVKSSIFFAVGRIIFVAETFCGSSIIVVVQVFCHPDLIPDFYGLVGLAVTLVSQCAELACLATDRCGRRT